VDADALTRLAALPSREALLAKLAGSMSSPLANLASVLAAPLRDLAGVMTAVAEQKRQTESAA
jgi:ribosomal protein L10